MKNTYSALLFAGLTVRWNGQKNPGGDVFQYVNPAKTIGRGLTNVWGRSERIDENGDEYLDSGSYGSLPFGHNPLKSWKGIAKINKYQTSSGPYNPFQAALA